MADPLSLTLAAISLATTLKDMIELAQKITDSFKKVRGHGQEDEQLPQPMINSSLLLTFKQQNL